MANKHRRFPEDPRQPIPIRDPHDTAKEVAYVGDTLRNSEGLDAEVVTWALYAVQTNPKMTVKQAIDYGYSEWVK